MPAHAGPASVPLCAPGRARLWRARGRRSRWSRCCRSCCWRGLALQCCTRFTCGTAQPGPARTRADHPGPRKRPPRMLVAARPGGRTQRPLGQPRRSTARPPRALRRPTHIPPARPARRRSARSTSGTRPQRRCRRRRCPRPSSRPAAGAVPVLVAALQPPQMSATALETVFEAAWAITNLAVVRCRRGRAGLPWLLAGGGPPALASAAGRWRRRDPRGAAPHAPLLASACLPHPTFPSSAGRV